MRRPVLALALAIGLVLGAMMPVSALGETSVTLNCDDGTSVKLVVDADTLTALTQAVQAMIDYPAELNCTLIQNPLGVSFGGIALAAGSGNEPFVVGGGRWLAETTCEALLGEEPGFVDGGVVARVPGSWAYGPIVRPLSTPSAQDTTTTIWVNIAVNVHQKNDGSLSFFGTLNETIPHQQNDVCGTISERHFTSHPMPPYPTANCLQTFSTGGGYPRDAVVTSHVTQLNGIFPGVSSEGDIHFSFSDLGQGPNPADLLQGAPELENSACPLLLTPPDNSLQNGNISVRNPES